MPAISKDKLYEIIFESDTIEGKRFDLTLLILIILSVVAVSLESVQSVQVKFGNYLYVFEWFITIVFSIEYCLRLYVVKRRAAFITSPLGIIDLLSILPAYLSLFLSGAQGLVVIRALRLLRVFRILKLAHYIYDSKYITSALKDSRRKITVFLFTILILVLIIGTAMYLIEGGRNGFNSIPESIYWAVVTLTTVGYGDITPVTIAGRFLASIVMILGYSIIAVPTGIVTAEFTKRRNKLISNQVCPECMYDDHDNDAHFCKKCGNKIN
jgi:voltage-gated potassium channel